VPGVTVNRLCASGLEAVGQAARAIALGDADVVLAGGVEGMSRAPYVLGKADAPFDARQSSRTPRWAGASSIRRCAAARRRFDDQTAEHLAREHGIARADQDAFALRSQQRGARASRPDRFDAEIMPVGACVADEQPRPTRPSPKLAALAPLLGPTAPSPRATRPASTTAPARCCWPRKTRSRAGAWRRGARVLGMAAAGVPPRTMGIGPVPAIERLLRRSGLRPGRLRHIEINEGVRRAGAGLHAGPGPADDTRRGSIANGGALALGHPLGRQRRAPRIDAMHALQRGEADRALIAMCVGVGQGVAMALEKMQ
jgi:acetyl-CoA acetyltransferase family protein